MLRSYQLIEIVGVDPVRFVDDFGIRKPSPKRLEKIVLLTVSFLAIEL